MNNLISAPKQILDGMPMGLVLLAYSPVIVCAIVLVIGTIIQTFQHLNKDD
jgi:hypothetical protein